MTGNALFRLLRFTCAMTLLILLSMPCAISQHTRYMGEAMFESTMDEYQMGRYEKAAEGFERFISFAPNDFNGHYLLAHCYRFLGRSDNALRMYLKAISIKPTDYDARLYAGELLEKLDRPEEAKSQYQKAHEILPNDPDAIVALGFLAIESGQHDEAASYFRDALNSTPSSENAHMGLGTLALGDKDYQQALKHFVAADSLSSGNLEIMALLAETNDRLGNKSAAEKLRSRIHEIER